MSSSHVILFHIRDDLYNFLSIKDLTVSNQNHISYILMHLLLNLDYVQQRIRYFGSPKVSIKIFDLLDSLLNVFIVILDTGLEHPLKIGPEANDVEDRVFGKRLKEQDERLLCLLDSVASH